MHDPYIPKDKDDLLLVLERLPDEMKVEADADSGISADTVCELRLLPSWPGGLVVAVPREKYPELALQISKPD